MNRQFEIPLMGEAYRIKCLPKSEQKTAKTMLEAVGLCIKASQTRTTLSNLSDHLSDEEQKIFRGNLSNALGQILPPEKRPKKKYNFPLNKLAKLERVCGNFAPLEHYLSEHGLSGYLEQMLTLRDEGIKPEHLEALVKLVQSGDIEVLMKLAA